MWIAHLVEHHIEEPGTILKWDRVPGAARDFSPSHLPVLTLLQPLYAVTLSTSVCMLKSQTLAATHKNTAHTWLSLMPWQALSKHIKGSKQCYVLGQNATYKSPLSSYKMTQQLNSEKVWKMRWKTNPFIFLGLNYVQCLEESSQAGTWQALFIRTSVFSLFSLTIFIN